MKKILSVLITISMILLLAACGQKGSLTDYRNAENDGAGIAASPEISMSASNSSKYELNNKYIAEGSPSDSVTGLTGIAASADRKLIRTASLTVETQDYDASVEKIKAMVAEFGGYMESASSGSGTSYAKNSGTRTGSFVLRIPADKLDSFSAEAAGIGNIIAESENVSDITLQYTDTASRVKALEVQRDSLIEMLAKAEKLEDLLTIQDHLTDVEYRLEAYASELRRYDNQVDYSTVSITLREVKIYTDPEPETFGEKLSRSFRSSLKGVGEFFSGLALFLVGNLPGIVVFLAFASAAVLLIRRVVRKLFGKNKTAKKAQPEVPEKDS